MITVKKQHTHLLHQPNVFNVIIFLAAGRITMAVQKELKKLDYTSNTSFGCLFIVKDKTFISFYYSIRMSLL